MDAKIQIGYLSKISLNPVIRHIIKDVDIYFTKDTPYILYQTHLETWDLLKELLVADFEEFAGTKIIANNR